MEERLFSKKHIWVLRDGDHVSIGLTDFIQKKLGPIMFLNLPQEGDKLSAGSSFGEVESKKTVLELESPVSGVVIETNEDLEDEPDAINENPNDSWLIKVKIDSLQDDLLNQEGYNKHISQPWMQDH